VRDPNFEYKLIPDTIANAYISYFTSNPNPFTAYSADRIEAMLKHGNMIAKNAHYVEYDPSIGCLVFRRPIDPMPYFDDEYKKVNISNSWSRMLNSIKKFFK
jgi:hypothetical protein